MFFKKKEIESSLLTDIFHTKDASFIKKISKIVHYKKWERIFRRWERLDWLFIILSGELYLFNQNWKTSILSEWSFFGEVALILSKSISSDAIVSSDDLTGLFIKKEYYLKLQNNSKERSLIKSLVSGKYQSTKSI